MNTEFHKSGYFIVKNLFEEARLASVNQVLTDFHQNWIEDNQAFYHQRAINSAYLTGKKYLTNEQRNILFDFIAHTTLISKVEAYIAPAAFLNTQLFFDPYNADQKNYWHRDIQYHMDLEQQKNTIETGAEMFHFRVPLIKEKGIQVIPGSHKRWDTQEQFEVRMEQNSRHSHDDLKGQKTIEVDRGDLLIFSAKMLHRGLYGGGRFALDILYSKPNSEYLNTMDNALLPDIESLSKFQQPEVFLRSYRESESQD